MRILKITFLLVTLLFIANTSFAQSSKAEAKAAKKVEKMNQAMISIDESLALSAEQTEKLVALQIQNRTNLKAVKESGASAEDQKAQKKEINKAFKKEVKTNILTEEQNAVQKQIKKKRKAAKK